MILRGITVKKKSTYSRTSVEILQCPQGPLKNFPFDTLNQLSDYTYLHIHGSTQNFCIRHTLSFIIICVVIYS